MFEEGSWVTTWDQSPFGKITGVRHQPQLSSQLRPPPGYPRLLCARVSGRDPATLLSVIPSHSNHTSEVAMPHQFWKWYRAPEEPGCWHPRQSPSKIGMQLTELRESKLAVKIRGLTPLSCFQVPNSCSITAVLPFWNHSAASNLSSPHPTQILWEFASCCQTGQQGSASDWKQGSQLSPASPSWTTTALCFGKWTVPQTSSTQLTCSVSTFFVGLFFSFVLTKETHLEKKKNHETQVGQRVAYYCNNIKRKLIHSSNTKLHMDSWLI